MALRCPICRTPHVNLKGNPLTVLKATPVALARLVRRTSPRLFARRPRRGEWSSRQVLAHLADAELANGFRIRKILSESRPRLTAFDQNAWARALRYSRRNPHQLLSAFRALRKSNLVILQPWSRPRRSRVGVHTEHGPIRLEQLVAHLADHDLNHLSQMRQNLRSLARDR
ncbi:MAG: DinB family protein [Candidatus Methylomirabilia bacterium]